jgi:hydroxymethylpyrimidine pyrophosphatase-like HAD family hydrolase
MPKNEFIAFDFDGVIAEYHGYKGEENEENPIKEIVETIRELKKQGCKVIIYSTRGDKFLKEYCEKHNIPVDYFNNNPKFENSNEGKPVAQVYIDDKTVPFKGQSPEQLVKEILDFKSYWDKTK